MFEVFTFLDQGVSYQVIAARSPSGSWAVYTDEEHHANRIGYVSYDVRRMLVPFAHYGGIIGPLQVDVGKKTLEIACEAVFQYALSYLRRSREFVGVD